MAATAAGLPVIADIDAALAIQQLGGKPSIDPDCCNSCAAPRRPVAQPAGFVGPAPRRRGAAALVQKAQAIETAPAQGAAVSAVVADWQALVHALGHLVAQITAGADGAGPPAAALPDAALAAALAPELLDPLEALLDARDFYTGTLFRRVQGPLRQQLAPTSTRWPLRWTALSTGGRWRPCGS
jgi:hypothetical protein